MDRNDGKKAAKAFVDTYFPQRQSTNSKHPDVLSDLFPPTSKQEAWRKQGYDGQSSNSQSAAADGYSKGKASKSSGSSPPNKSSGSAVVFCEVKGEPCSMSSSVDYGCRDNYIPTSSKGQPGNYYDKKDRKDGYEYPDPEHTRGEWWQGSLYY